MSKFFNKKKRKKGSRQNELKQHTSMELTKNQILNPKKINNDDYFFSQVFNNSHSKNKLSSKKRKALKKQIKQAQIKILRNHIASQKSITELNSPRFSTIINECNLTNIKEFSQIKTRLEQIEERISNLQDTRRSLSRNNRSSSRNKRQHKQKVCRKKMKKNKKNPFEKDDTFINNDKPKLAPPSPLSKYITIAQSQSASNLQYSKSPNMKRQNSQKLYNYKGNESSKLWLMETFFFYLINIKEIRKNKKCHLFNKDFEENLLKMMQAFYMSKFLVFVQGGIPFVELDENRSRSKKKTLILDLDETLIHCVQPNEEQISDVELPIIFPTGETIKAKINLRPHVNNFLKEMAKIFELIIFTASHSCYANVIIDYLDPHNKYISHRFYRESCVKTEQGVYIKDLSIFYQRSMKDLIIVDNAPYSFCKQVENGIPIVSFMNQKDDKELKALIPYLKKISKADDIRKFNKYYLKLHKYFESTSVEQLIDKLCKN